MFLCRRWGNSCRISSSSSPRVCLLLPSRLSTCPRSHRTGLRRALGTVCVNRRWWNSCRTSCSSSPHSHLFPSRLSKCRRSCLSMFLCDVCVATRSWGNSWWKCRRSYPILCCSGLWSKTWAFQLLVVEGESLVFKVFFPDRIQQHVSSRSSVFNFQVASSSRFPAVLDDADDGIRVVFHTFDRLKKSARVAGQVSAQPAGRVSSSTLSAHQMARACVAAHLSSGATEVDHDVKYMEYNDLWWVCQWVEAEQRYDWWFVENPAVWDHAGSWHGPKWKPPWVWMAPP